MPASCRRRTGRPTIGCCSACASARTTVSNYFTVLPARRSSKLGDRLFAVEPRRQQARRAARPTTATPRWKAHSISARSAACCPTIRKHILMVLDGYNGRSLFKVEHRDRAREQMERAQPKRVTGWWLDVDGNPVVRIDGLATAPCASIARTTKDKWKKFYSDAPARDGGTRGIRADGALGQSRQVLRAGHARPDTTASGIYLYDLKKEHSASRVVENPKYDLTPRASRATARRVLQLLLHGARARSANSRIPSSTRTCGPAQVLRGIRERLRRTTPPRTARPSCCTWKARATRRLTTTTGRQEEHRDRSAPSARRSTTRHVPTATSSTTRRATARSSTAISPCRPARLPRRQITADRACRTAARRRATSLTFDPGCSTSRRAATRCSSPTSAARDGFGRSLRRERLRRVGPQDAGRHQRRREVLVDQGVVDPARVCIVGASYGGYAALAGATLTPDLYKCAVSIAGIVRSRRVHRLAQAQLGLGLRGLHLLAQGHRRSRQGRERLRAVSPAAHRRQIKVPVLLIHGDDDYIVPYRAVDAT